MARARLQRPSSPPPSVLLATRSTAPSTAYSSRAHFDGWVAANPSKVGSPYHQLLLAQVAEEEAEKRAAKSPLAALREAESAVDRLAKKQGRLAAQGDELAEKLAVIQADLAKTEVEVAAAVACRNEISAKVAIPASEEDPIATANSAIQALQRISILAGSSEKGKTISSALEQAAILLTALAAEAAQEVAARRAAAESAKADGDSPAETCPADIASPADGDEDMDGSDLSDTLLEEETQQLASIKTLLEGSGGDAASPQHVMLRSVASVFEKRTAAASKLALRRGAKLKTKPGAGKAAAGSSS